MNFPAKKVMQRYAFVASILMILGIAILGKALYIMTVLQRWRSQAQDDDGHIISLILIACDVYHFMHLILL